MSAIKVLVVDDSAFMRKVISDILSSEPGIRVVATAKDGNDAIEKNDLHTPDVITLDLDMPVMNGLDALRKIMATKPTAVLMVSARTQEGARETLECLEAGAVDFVAKSGGTISLNLKDSGAEIIAKVKSASKARLNTSSELGSRKITISPSVRLSGSITVIGSSTGGPPALEKIIPLLPEEYPSPILMVQHMPEGFTRSFADRLNRLSNIEVREAKDGDILKPGLALLAPGGYHMTIRRMASLAGKPVMVRLNKNPPEQGVRPCIDVTIRSVVDIYQKNILGVILTGMGHDGTEGLTRIRDSGGKNLAEEPKDCVIDSMPKSAISAGVIDHVVPLREIAEQMSYHITRLGAKS